MTRKFLKELGIESDAIDKIIEEHRGTVDILKDELDTAKAEAAKRKEVETELNALKDEMKSKDSYKEKYDTLKEEYENYKAGIDSEKKEAVKIEAYKAVLKEAGIAEKRIESVLRLAKADGYIDSLEFDGDKIKNIKDVKETVKNSYGDYIETKSQEGADVPQPPTGGNPSTFKDMPLADKMAFANANPNAPEVISWLKGE